LRARFDEAANIELASRLQAAGAHVVYGVVGYKTHAKMLLVVKREADQIKRYLHLGTGNYHVGTARVYVDMSFFTADELICEDVHRVFQQLTGLGKATKLKKLLQSPFTLHKSLLKLIDNEAENARNGNDTKIIIKVNSLVEPSVIQALYHASQAGVKIDLIVRGICCLRPGVPGVSEHISVRSIVGRFLEHSRIFYFYNNGDDKLYCASADWMDRNFFSRVEVCFPIEDPEIKKEMLKFGLNVFLKDNTKAWVLQENGEYIQTQPGSEEPYNAQLQLLEKYAAEISAVSVE
jgi:polyphosphate kinase